MEELKSTRGKTQFSHESYIYVVDRLSADRSKKIWWCQLKNECKARLHTTADSSEVLAQINQHTHESDAAQLQAAVIMTGMKRRAAESTEILSVILNTALQGTSSAVQAKLPRKDAVRKLIQRSRKRHRRCSSTTGWSCIHSHSGCVSVVFSDSRSMGEVFA